MGTKFTTEATTEAVLCEHLWQQVRQKRSLRSIAADYGEPIRHTDIQRALKGKFPVGIEKRLALGLPAMKPAPVCPIHNIVEQYDYRTQIVRAKPKPKQKKKRDRYPRYTAYWFESTKEWR